MSQAEYCWKVHFITIGHCATFTMATMEEGSTIKLSSHNETAKCWMGKIFATIVILEAIVQNS